MDDNRLLTLPSNERIRLLPHMKVGMGRGRSMVCARSQGLAGILQAAACGTVCTAAAPTCLSN